MAGNSQIIEAIVEDFRIHVDASANYVVMGGSHQAKQQKYDNLAIYVDGMLSASDVLSKLRLGSEVQLNHLKIIKDVLLPEQISELDKKRADYLERLLSATDEDLVMALKEARQQLIPLLEQLRRVH